MSLTVSGLLDQRIEDGCAAARVAGLERAEVGQPRGWQAPAHPLQVKRADGAVPVAQRIRQLGVEIEVPAPPSGVSVAAGGEDAGFGDADQDEVSDAEPPLGEELAIGVHLCPPLPGGSVAGLPEAPDVCQLERVGVADRDPAALFSLACRIPPRGVDGRPVRRGSGRVAAAIRG